MSFRVPDSTLRVSRSALAGLTLSLLAAIPASAQSQGARPAIGENYRLEVMTSWWKPGVLGSVSSDALDIVGSRIDLVSDLGFGEARFKDWRVTLRPAKKHKIRFQYTPLQYSAEGVLTRDITFAGKVFPVSLPLASELTWKVWRFGYEWDVVYTERGFIGVLVEARKTELEAALTSLLAEGAVAASAPLPSIGVVARVYPLPDLAINFELSGMKAPPIDDKYEGNYTDIDVSATVNITNNLGVSGGWRRLNTALRIERDFGDLKFSGMWFGAALRF